MIYLDNAATTYPKPREVSEAVSDCIRRIGGNPGRGAHTLSLRAAEVDIHVWAPLYPFWLLTFPAFCSTVMVIE